MYCLQRTNKDENEGDIRFSLKNSVKLKGLNV